MELFYRDRTIESIILANGKDAILVLVQMLIFCLYIVGTSTLPVCQNMGTVPYLGKHFL